MHSSGGKIEIICSDPAGHRRRVEGTTIDVPGLTPPTRAEVQAAVRAGEYEPWSEARMVINTARVQAEEAVATAVAAMVKRSSGKAKFR